jgi:hypothetical protein
MSVWKIERRADGQVEVLFSDASMVAFSCGLCSQATPKRMVFEWCVDNGNLFDVFVDEEGRAFVNLPASARGRQ